MSDNAIPKVSDGMIRDRMKIVPLGQAAPKLKTRFSEGLMRAMSGEGVCSWVGSKRRRIEGELVGKASAVIADPYATDDDLRSAFLRVSEALEGEMLRGIALEKRLHRLEAEIGRLKADQKTEA
ncbi:hypothetical protein ACWGM0_17775 [Sphingomonas bisphenolicum]